MWSRLQQRIQPLSGNSEFRIIGPRKSGKTTYLAALAYWPDAKNAKSNSPIESVEPKDDDTVKLIGMAQDILETGASLAGTYLPDAPDLLPPYSLSIKMKPAFGGGNQRFEVTCKDFAGELFDKLRSGNTAETKLYLEECAEAPGLLIILDGTFFTEDQKYAQGLENLKSQVKLRLREKNKALNNYRTAVVFSKAEQAQVWIHRHDIPKFMRLKFNQTYQTLERWSKEWQCPINYFLCSAFGMKVDRQGAPPTPNVKVTSRENGVTLGVINRPEDWQPFGLVAPIYWLYTGKDNPKLREMED